VAGGHPDRRGDVLGGGGEADDAGLAGRDAGVPPVERELERLRPDPVRAEDRPEVGQERVVVDARSLPTCSIRSVFAHEEDGCEARPASG
jgi:hypothetical protein